MLQRQTPSRNNSFADKVRGSLSRSLSFNRRGCKPLSNHANDEMNVFASDIVSKEYILDRLKEVHHDHRIVKLEVEDLLIAMNRNCFLPVVKALLITDERDWKYLRFMDTIPSNDFLWWQGMKHVLMREYEDTINDTSVYSKLVSFQANIQVLEGASKKCISSLLKDILQDMDVSSISFGGALFGYHDATLPGALLDVMDESTGLLKQHFVISVKCGWRKKSKKGQEGVHEEEEEEGLQDWGKVLKSLHRAMRQLGRATPNPQEEHTVSVASADAAVTAVSVRGAASSANSEGRIPRTSRHGRTPRRHNSNSLRIVQGGTRRCITMPTPASSERCVPTRARTFQLKRPTLESLATGFDASVDNRPMAPQRKTSFARKRPTLTRAKSFHIKRPGGGSLDGSRPSRVRSADCLDEKRAAVDIKRPLEGNRSAFFELVQMEERKPKVDVPAKAPIRRSTGHSPVRRTSSSKSNPLRRCKSMNHPQDPPRREVRRTRSCNKSPELNKHKRETSPDYDWSSGDYVDKRVLPSAA